MLQSYLEYALVQEIIRFEDFFRKVMDCIEDESSPLLSTSKLLLLIEIIEKFLPSFKFGVFRSLFSIFFL